MRSEYPSRFMADKASRNEPCPCGSGKKYKKCCLLKEEAAANEQASRDTAVPRVLEWLHERHSEAIQHALEEDFFGGLEESQRKELEELPEDHLQMVYLNAFEWLLAEGGIQTGENAQDFGAVMQIVLGDGGPTLDAGQRQYLTLLGQAPLGLYEVAESRPDEGFWLMNTLENDPERFWVQEGAASHSIDAGHTFAARVVALEPKILSGAIYAFERPHHATLRQAILDGPDNGSGSPDPLWISTCVIDAWLATLVAPPPEITDASTGETILLTTAHYRIKDGARLEQVLADEAHVEHNGDNEWARLEPSESEGEGDSEEGRKRIVATLTKTSDDRLELFTRTEAAATDNAAWLDKIAGDALEALEREVVDPREHRGDAKKAAPAEDAKDAPEPAPEERTSLLDAFYRKTYADWADEPIPTLGDKTPREAVGTAEGKRAVLELLTTYQLAERDQAKEQEREACDLGFLWESVGLKPEG